METHDRQRSNGNLHPKRKTNTATCSWLHLLTWQPLGARTCRPRRFQSVRTTSLLLRSTTHYRRHYEQACCRYCHGNRPSWKEVTAPVSRVSRQQLCGFIRQLGTQYCFSSFHRYDMSWSRLNIYYAVVIMAT